MEDKAAVGLGQRSFRSTGIRASKHLACPNCQAPGVFASTKWMYEKFPKNYVDPGDPRDNECVGNTCPTCGDRRSPSLTVALGEIWRKFW